MLRKTQIQLWSAMRKIAGLDCFVNLLQVECDEDTIRPQTWTLQAGHFRDVTCCPPVDSYPTVSLKRPAAASITAISALCPRPGGASLFKSPSKMSPRTFDGTAPVN